MTVEEMIEQRTAALQTALGSANSAITAKGGTGDATTISGLADAIDSIPSGSDVTVEPLSVTENGTYTAQTGKAYSPVTVDVPTGGVVPFTKITVTTTSGVTTLAAAMSYFSALVPHGTTYVHGIWKPDGVNYYTSATVPQGNHNGEFFCSLPYLNGTATHTRYYSGSWQGNPTASGTYDSPISAGDVYDLFYTDSEAFARRV